MPVEKVRGGYRWGKRGRVYPTKKQTEKQWKAIKSSQSKRKKKS